MKKKGRKREGKQNMMKEVSQPTKLHAPYLIFSWNISVQSSIHPFSSWQAINYLYVCRQSVSHSFSLKEKKKEQVCPSFSILVGALRFTLYFNLPPQLLSISFSLSCT